MLCLTKRTDYALIALADLDKHREEVTSARHIARSFRIPVPLLMNILKDLQRHGLIKSVRGARGGYYLARDLNKISLADLLEIMEGPAKLVACATSNGKARPCSRGNECPIQMPMARVQKKFAQFLRKVNLADLVGQGRSG